MHNADKREYVAFLEGYDWHHYSPETITIKIRSPEEFSDPSVVVETVKREVEKVLNEKRFWQGEISERVFVWLNA